MPEPPATTGVRPTVPCVSDDGHLGPHPAGTAGPDPARELPGRGRARHEENLP